MAFSLPLLQSCCFCISVKLGSLIIGYFSLFSSCVSLAGVSYSIYRVSDYVKTQQNSPKPDHSPEELAAGALRIYITHAVYLLVYLYYCIISLLLIVGIHKNKPRLMRFYVNTGLFLLAMVVALVVVTVVFMGVLATIPLLISSVVLFYCILVVRSAYIEMEEANKPRVYELTTIHRTQQAPLMA